MTDEIEYKYFAIVWGIGGTTRGAFNFSPLKSTSLEDAKKEADGIQVLGQNVDPLDPVVYLACRKGSSQPLSTWELQQMHI